MRPAAFDYICGHPISTIIVTLAALLMPNRRTFSTYIAACEPNKNQSIACRFSA